MGNTDKEKNKSAKSKHSDGGKEKKKIRPAEPDVVLDIQEVKVEEVKIKVRNLKTNVSFDARLGKMVKINVGAEANIGSVNIEIDNMRTEAYLRVRLERVKQILNTTVKTMDRNFSVLKPQLLPLTKITGKSFKDLRKEEKQTLTGVSSTTKELGKTIRRDIRKPVKKGEK